MFRPSILFCVIFGALAKPPQEKCKLSDKNCLLTMTNQVYSSFFDVSKELDPLHIDKAEASLPGLTYTVSDTTAKGFSNCKIEDIHMDIEKIVYDVSFLCPLLNVDGQYTVSGHLKEVPFEGNGYYKMNASNYAFKVLHAFDFVSVPRGTSIQVNHFDLDLDPRDRVVTQIDNLFNGDEEKAARIKKIFDEDWKEVTKKLHGPILHALLEKIIKVSNEFYKNNVLEDFISL